jgi:hypothetical protein
MHKSLNKIRLLTLLIALASATMANQSLAQVDPSVNGGLRGPQDIINSTNARDSYGNLRQPDPGTNPSYQNSYSANSASPEAGAIRPFTDNANGYQAPNQGYQVDPNAYQNAPTTQGSGIYQPQAAPGAPVSYPYSSKHHHHHKQKPPLDPTGAPISSPAGAYTGSSTVAPNGSLSSGPPDPSYAPPHQGNKSVGGAVVGVPDRAAKTAVGVTGKAAKEVLKALF